MSATHLVSVVIPVYGGEITLPGLLEEIAAHAVDRSTPEGHPYRVTEVVLVHDNGRDDSARVMRELEERYDFVRTIWLSKNFGQHAATFAGMASAGGEWIVTLDEDGQHDPAFIPVFLDTAMREQSPLVYAKPTNPPSHGAFRNAASRGAKWFLRMLAGPNATEYQSYRLVLGSYGRSVAAYAGAGVYLDVALGWIAPSPAQTPITLRDEGERVSGYNLRRLLSHFWRMVLTGGTRGLRLVSWLGVLFAVGGVVVALYILLARVAGGIEAEGWASTVIIALLGFGAILFSLGVVAEYIGVAVNAAMGKPPYLILSDPQNGPLGRRLRRS